MLKINFLTWVVLAFVGSPMVALAQEPLRPSHIKELAKAKFEGSAIDRQALVRAKLEAAGIQNRTTGHIFRTR